MSKHAITSDIEEAREENPYQAALARRGMAIYYSEAREVFVPRERRCHKIRS